MRAVDTVRGEFVRFISENPSAVSDGYSTTVAEDDLLLLEHAGSYYEVRHALKNGMPTFNKEREGKYRGYGVQLLSNRRRSVVNVHNEDEDDCFISFGPAKSVLSVTTAHASDSLHGSVLFEVSRRSRGAYGEWDECAAMQFAQRCVSLLSFARTLVHERRQLRVHARLHRALMPVSLARCVASPFNLPVVHCAAIYFSPLLLPTHFVKRSLTGEPELLHALAMRSKELLGAERCVWYLCDDGAGCFRSKLQQHGTEIKARYGRGSILDVVRNTKKYCLVRDVKSTKRAQGGALQDADSSDRRAPALAIASSEGDEDIPEEDARELEDADGRRNTLRVLLGDTSTTEKQKTKKNKNKKKKKNKDKKMTTKTRGSTGHTTTWDRKAAEAAVLLAGISTDEGIDPAGSHLRQLQDPDYVGAMGEVMTVLCVPIMDHASGKCLGVAQAINRQVRSEAYCDRFAGFFCFGLTLTSYPPRL